MSEDAIRETIFSTLQAEFAAVVSGCDLVPENTKHNQSTRPWLYMQLVPARSARKEISSSGLTDHTGVINVLCMVPQDSGTKKMWEMVDAVYRILADRNWSLPGDNGGRLTLCDAEKRNRGLINGYYTATVMTDYRLEKRLVRP